MYVCICNVQYALNIQVVVQRSCIHVCVHSVVYKYVRMYYILCTCTDVEMLMFISTVQTIELGYYCTVHVVTFSMYVCMHVYTQFTCVVFIHMYLLTYVLMVCIHIIWCRK